MIGELIASVNQKLIQIASVIDGQQVQLRLAEDAQYAVTSGLRASVGPTTETFDVDVQTVDGQASVRMRVVTLEAVLAADSLASTEQLINDVCLAIYLANYGSAELSSITWDRATRTNQWGRECSLYFTIKVPILRRLPRHLQPQTVFMVALPDGEPDVVVELATVAANGVHAQTSAATVWHCVFAGQQRGTYISNDTGQVPTLSYPDERTIDLTFSSPVLGRAFFVNP